MPPLFAGADGGPIVVVVVVAVAARALLLSQTYSWIDAAVDCDQRKQTTNKLRNAVDGEEGEE